MAEDRAGAKSSRLIKIDLLLTCCKKKKKKGPVISAFIPFHMFNDTLLSLMFLFLYQTEQLSAVPLGADVPLIHSPPARALAASMQQRTRRETDLRNHQIATSEVLHHIIHLLTDARGANALALYAATPFRRKCSANVLQICIIIIRTRWL